MKRYVYSMAITKRAAIANIQSISLPLIEHLLKLYMFPNSGHCVHWAKEVRNFLYRVPRLKGSNKLLGYKAVREAVSVYEDQIGSCINGLEKEYRDLEIERSNVQEAESLVSKYLDWICTAVCNGEEISSFDVMGKLNELGFEIIFE